MCNFLSVLILRDGSVRHHPLLDSHSDLVRYFESPDTNAYIPHFAETSPMKHVFIQEVPEDQPEESRSNEGVKECSDVQQF